MTFPSELLEHYIFPNLPLAQLLACRFVCRNFCRVATKIIAQRSGNTSIIKKRQSALKECFEYEWKFLEWSLIALRFRILAPPMKCLETAAKAGHADVLRNIHLRTHSAFPSPVCAAAAAGGHRELLQWLHSIGCRMKADCTAAAAGSGHIQLLQWLHEELRVPLHYSAWMAAAEGGHLDMLQWLHSYKGALGQRLDLTKCANHAAKFGHTNVIKWLLQLGWKYSGEDVAFSAAFGERPEMLRELCELGFNVRYLSVARGVASNSDVNLLRWLYSIECPMDPSVMSIAAAHGHKNILLYMRHDIGLAWPADITADAARHGFEMVKWLRQHDPTIPWAPFIIQRAIFYGKLDVLRYAVENGCSLSASDYTCAIDLGNLDALKYLIEKKRPITAHQALINRARQHGRYEIAQWLQEHNIN